MQKELHRWAVTDPDLDRCFDDLANLVYDPAFLVVAWNRVLGSKDARTAGIDWVTPVVSGGASRICWPRSETTSRLAGSPPAGAGEGDPEGVRQCPSARDPDHP
jgi:hypothetical protein